MSRFHAAKKTSADETAHANWMGGKSWDISNPILALRISASSCFFGEPMYYHKDKDDTRPVRVRHGAALSNADVEHLRATLDAVDPREWRTMSPAELMESTIDKALDFDVEATLKEAVRLRNEEHMRTTPQVILVRAAHHLKAKGTGLVRIYAPQIIRRADEPSVGLAYHSWRYKNKPLPNSLKKAWRAALASTKEHHLAKYRMEERGSKTVDVVNLVHPKSDAVDKLVKGELKTTDQTWEAIISKEGSTKQAWEKALDVMGHMGLLRNLRNLLGKKIDPDFFLTKLVDGAKTGKQLPFRYYSAYNAVKGDAPGRVLDAIEQCLKTSLGNLPSFKGRLMALSDNSGSAQSATTSSMGSVQISTIGNLTGILAAMRADDGHLGVFGDQLETFAVRAASSVFDQLERAQKIAGDIGTGTENGIWLFWDKAIKQKEHWDNVFVFSDMQAGHGGLYGTNPHDYRDYLWHGGRNIDVAKLINTYRSKVNPDVNVFLVQIAGHKDVIVPEFYKRTFILGGWGEGLLRFAAEMAGLSFVQTAGEHVGGYRTAGAPAQQ